MQIKKLTQSIIGSKGFVLEDISHSPETNDFIFHVHLTKRLKCRCGICHKVSVFYDKGRGRRRWRCKDIGNGKAYVEADAPRVFCPEHGIVTAAVPWSRHGSRFTIDFENTVVWLATHSAHSAISELMRIEWHTVGHICKRVYRKWENSATSRFNNLVNIGIDETSYKKGHKYMTVVVNHDTNSVIWCAVGFGSRILSRFFESLTEEQRASICCVTADGARWIASCISKYCPNAKRCVDPFHVVSWAMEALEKVRHRALAEIRKRSAPVEKRGPGRPKKGEQVESVSKKAKAEKFTKFALLKNPENLTSLQKEQVDFLSKADPQLYRAYLLKENLRLLLKADESEIVSSLKKWMSWAQRCRIPEFRDLRKKLKRHFEAITATARYGLSNARIEATNNKIKLTIRMAYGFRNMENLLAMVMLNCSDIVLQLHET